MNQQKNSAPLPGAWSALVLLLTINLFNYIDRQVLAAVEPEIRATFFAPNDINAMAKTGSLATAFLFIYMFSAPLLGWLADRMSRWLLIGVSVILWSLASGASGLATTFAILFATRIFVGIGEGAYGPAAPTILADLFPLQIRGRILAYLLRGHSGWKRSWICARRIIGNHLGLALGLLFGHSARAVARVDLFFHARSARAISDRRQSRTLRLEAGPSIYCERLRTS